MDLEMELFYPEIRVTIEEYELQEGIEIEVYSSADSYFDWQRSDLRSNSRISFRLVGRLRPVSSSAMMESSMTYSRGMCQSIFFCNQNEIILKDGMILLEETIVSNTFLDVTPQEMLNYLLGKAGISNSVLSPKMFPKKARLPILQKTALAVIEDIRSIWKAQMPFFFSGNSSTGESSRNSLSYTSLSMPRISSHWSVQAVHGNSKPCPSLLLGIRMLFGYNIRRLSGEFAVKKVCIFHIGNGIYPNSNLLLRRAVSC
ncbi:serine/arginine repetitive matrix protein 2 [Paenibacillus melissococcoides]|uniref:serine/arginine repetitive matrix protein 2 n=1 Tax=Paenibacillus melissococcoides TaxID=2912268 RepID=UPI0021C402D3|nr:serine/arginine repetitive matrix protein 2 [Paenibacillus melissococcoides]CAH8721362.1 serine/arginine repetitive matrix protein 2 [Paenibacillus melissococcoides]CAH8721956.1 serine/arginine repetitive matrix protein 2 [Paenibacillus melissococcoides]